MEEGDEPLGLVDQFVQWLGRYGRVSPTNLPDVWLLEVPEWAPHRTVVHVDSRLLIRLAHEAPRMDGGAGPPRDADQRLGLQFAIDNFIGANIVQGKVTLDYRIVQGADGLHVETVEVRERDILAR